MQQMSQPWVPTPRPCYSCSRGVSFVAFREQNRHRMTPCSKATHTIELKKRQHISNAKWNRLTMTDVLVQNCSILFVSPGSCWLWFFLHFCSVSCRPSGIKRYTHGMDGKGVRTPSWSLQFPNRKDGGPMVPCCLRQWSWTWTKRPSAVISQCEKIPWQPWQLIWQLIWQKRWVVFYVKCCRMYFRMPVLYLDDFTIWLWLT